MQNSGIGNPCGRIDSCIGSEDNTELISINLPPNESNIFLLLGNPTKEL